MHSQGLLLNMSAVDVGGGGVAVYIQRPQAVYLNCSLQLYFSIVFLNCISQLYLSTVFLNIILQSLQLTYGGHHMSDVCGEFAGILSLVQLH